MTLILNSQNEELAEMSGGLPGAVGAALITYLNMHVMQNNLGTVFNADTDFVLAGIGNRRPNIAFATFETVPEITGDVVPVPPNLAVEVVSKSDATDDSDLNILEYQQAGIKLIWLVRTVRRLVEVYHPGDEKPTVLGASDILTGEDVVKGFELPLQKLFALPNAKWRSPSSKATRER